MRFPFGMIMAGFVAFMAVPAMAQTAYQTTNTGVPIYVPSTTGQAYTTTQTGVTPFYNNTAQPLPLQQMVAGKNAPSYNFKNQVQPYNLNTASMNSNGALTPDEVDRIRASRDAQAQAYQKQFLEQSAQNGQPQTIGGAMGNAYNSLMPTQDKPKPTKKRLVYRESANPLSAPPRLFNPDQ